MHLREKKGDGCTAESKNGKCWVHSLKLMLGDKIIGRVKWINNKWNVRVIRKCFISLFVFFGSESAAVCVWAVWRLHTYCILLQQIGEVTWNMCSWPNLIEAPSGSTRTLRGPPGYRDNLTRINTALIFQNFPSARDLWAVFLFFIFIFFLFSGIRAEVSLMHNLEKRSGCKWRLV